MFPLNTAVKTVYTLEHHFYCSRSRCFPEGTHLWNLVKRKGRSNLQKTDLQTTLRYILHATTFWIMLLFVPWWPTGANASFMRTQVPPPALLLPSWHKTAAPAHLKTWYHHRLHLKLNQLSFTSTYWFWTMGLMAKVSRVLPKITEPVTGWAGTTWEPNDPTTKGPTKLFKDSQLSARQEACASLLSSSLVKTYKTAKLQELYSLMELIWFKCRVLWSLSFIIQN